MVTPALLDLARRRRDALRRGAEDPTESPSAACEISEKSEESRTIKGLISHNSLFSHSVSVRADADNLLMPARARISTLRRDVERIDARQAGYTSGPARPVNSAVNVLRLESDCEISEKGEKRSDDQARSGLMADPFRAWRLRNAEHLAEAGGQLGDDYAGFCAVHRRLLSYPEQKRGACSWFVAPSFAAASGAAFLVSELADFAVYSPIRERHWLTAVALSNTVGLVVDSALFLWLAFGSLDFLAGQIVGKAYVMVATVALLWLWRWSRQGRRAEALA